MARKGSIENNDHRKELVKKLANKRAELKKIIYDKSLPLEERFHVSAKLAKLPRNSSAVRVRSRCELTGRPRAVYRFFGLSRIALRDLSMSGKLPGVKRSSW